MKQKLRGKKEEKMKQTNTKGNTDKNIFSTLIKRRVGDDGVPAILQYRPSIYIRRIGRKLWQFCKKIPTPLSAFANKAFPCSSFSPTR